jgi:4-hydroxy-2-oxoheptanedioate aldolase
MTLSLLADRLRGGDTVLTAWCGIPDPMVRRRWRRRISTPSPSTCSMGCWTSQQRSGPFRSWPRPASRRSRASRRDFASASKLLDNGASAVIAPMINTLEDARRFAAYMKYRRWASAAGAPPERWR